MANSFEKRYALRESISVFQAEVYVAEIDGNTYVVKDFSHAPAFLKYLVLRSVVSREYRILQKVENVKGVPGPGHFAARDTLTIKYVPDAEHMPSTTEELQAEGVGVGFFGEMRRIVNEMHHAGVVHGDLRRKNILIGPEGPFVIDFATGLQCDKSSWRIRKFLWRIVRRIDRMKMLELQASYFPDSLSADDEAELNNPPSLLALGRFLRKHIYRPLIKPERWYERLCWLKKTTLGE